MKRNYIINILVLFLNIGLILSLAFGFAYYIKKENFPFVSFVYTDSINDFNSVPDKNLIMKFSNLNLKMNISDSAKSSILKELKLPNKNKKDIFTVSKSITEYVRKKLFLKYNMIDNINEILECDTEIPALCSGYSKFLTAVAQSAGHPSRIVWLWHHVVPEIYFAGYGWVTVDPLYNTIAIIDSKFASTIDIDENYNKVKLKTISNKANIDDENLNKFEYDKVFPNNKLFVILEGPRLLDFEHLMRNPISIIKYILGKDIVKGIQYTKNRKKIGNKRNYLRLFLLIELVLFLILIYNLYKTIVLFKSKNINN